MFKRLKKYILAFKSPIKWATFALSIAISLFCIEISLSWYSIYLSLVEGVVEVTILTETIAFVMFILFGLAGLAILGIAIFVGVVWFKARSEDNTLKIKKDITKIKERLGIQEDKENGGHAE